jgi:tetratricopeptide (TPR) repeat protein
LPPPEDVRDLTDVTSPLRDYFEGCRADPADSRFIVPTWYLVGHHFKGRYVTDFEDEDAEWAISAFRRVVETDERSHLLYAYAIAETGHLMNILERSADAIPTYRLFLDRFHAGDFRAYQQKAEAQVENVLNGLVVALTSRFWVGDRAAQSPAQRAEDPSLIPVDAPWYQDLALALVEGCCIEEGCDTWQKRAGVYRLFIRRFPTHARTPEMLRRLLQLYQDEQGAVEDDPVATRERTEATECMALYREGSGLETPGVDSSGSSGLVNTLCPDRTVGRRWLDENRDRPELLQEAEEQAEQALQSAAAQYHEAADVHQEHCDNGVAESCDLARRMYGLAVAAYLEILRQYSSSGFTYDNMYNLGVCYYSLGMKNEAIEQFRRVENSSLSVSKQRDALANQINILGERFRPEMIPETPPAHEETDAEGNRRIVADPAPIPTAVSEWHDAMRRWIQRYPADPKNLGYRRAIAAHLYYLGHWDRAGADYQALFDEYCGDPAQRQVGFEAFQILDGLARSSGDRARVEELRQIALTSPCTTELVDGIEAEMIGEQFTEASRLYLRATETNDRDGLREAARKLLEVVEQHPDHASTPAAIRMAAIAYQNAEEWVRAVETWNQLIRHCSPPTDYAEQCERAAQVAGSNRISVTEAYYYVARNAGQTFDLEEARRNYQLLERTAGRPPRNAQFRTLEACLRDRDNPCTDLEFNVVAVRRLADVNRLLGQYSESARYVRRIIDEGYETDAAKIAAMRLDIVTLYESGRAWADMRSAADDYIGIYGNDRNRRFDVLRVRLILHRDAERTRERRAIDRAVTALEEAYDRLSPDEKNLVGDFGLTPAQKVVVLQDILNTQDILGKPRFDALESKFRQLERYQFTGRSIRSLGADIGTFNTNVVRMVTELTNGYSDILARYPVAPTWGVACRYRIALAWNIRVDRLATLEQKLRPEWLAFEVAADGSTVRDLLDNVVLGIRDTQVIEGVTIDNVIHWNLVGTGRPETRGILGALTFARNMSVSNEWVRLTIEMVRRLALSSDPQQVFANGRMPEVTGLAIGDGLDPVNQ